MKNLLSNKLVIAFLLVLAASVAYYYHTKYVVKKAQEKSDAIGSDFTIAIKKA